MAFSVSAPASLPPLSCDEGQGAMLAFAWESLAQGMGAGRWYEVR